MAEKYAKDGLVVLGLTADSDAAAVRKYATDQGAKHRILLEPDLEVEGAYEIGPYPSSLIVDREGRRSELHVGWEAGDDELLEGQVRAALGLPK